MADAKISALTNLTAADPTNDMIPIVDVSDTPPASGNTKRISINNILAASGTATLASATITGALTVDTTTLVVDATNDRVGIGTATPGYPLQVVGNAFFNADATCKRFFVNDTTGAANAYINGANGSQSVINLGGQTNYNIGAIIYDDASNFLAFRTNNVEAARFNSTGNLVLKGGTAAANGVGITFPAAQVASSDANCLDDYEEGTFTATLNGSVSDPATLITTVGRYTKVGREVTVEINFSNITTTGYSGRITIAGLPFAQNGNNEIASIVGLYGIATFTGSPFGLTTQSATTISMWSSISNGAFQAVNFNAGSGQYLWSSLTYTV